MNHSVARFRSSRHDIPTMRKTILLTAIALAIVVFDAPASAQGLPTATPESVGLSSAQLDRVTAGLQAHIDQGHIAGVVAAVVRDGRLVYMEALGQADIEAARPMPEDAIFRLYSMTRSMTSLAAMILWEEGAFQLDDPISQYLPQFVGQRVFADARSPDMDQTQSRDGDITVEHLLLHTSGLGSRSSGIYRAEGVRLRSISVEQMVDNAARTPLFEDPGTNWRYGISTTILGRLVEVWSGKPLEDYLQERVFRPLGMTDTGFWVEPERADRLATVYRASREGELRPYQMEEIPFTEQPILIEGGVGLVASTMDFLRFSQMFLNGGELDGNRVLQPETIAMMTVNRIPDALLPIGFGRPTLGQGWGLGFSIVMDASQYAYPVNDGDFWWDGSAGTRFWIDPTENMVTIVMAQVSPASGRGFREEFKTGVDEAITERR
jgi:CubicO group peptidase (beta-lactamase class C family)